MTSYLELLRHPKWQEMRLRVMERDRFTCRRCGTTEKTLNVHHGYYEKGKKPWEYDPGTLHTLCEDCHKLTQQIMTAIHFQIACIVPDSGLEELAWLIRRCDLVELAFALSLPVAERDFDEIDRARQEAESTLGRELTPLEISELDSAVSAEADRVLSPGDVRTLLRR